MTPRSAVADAAPVSRRPVEVLQERIGNRAVQRLISKAPEGVIRRDSYPFGSANTIPHIHKYKKGSHLKIVHRGSVKRYNLVQNGRRHSQADTALEAAEGNDALLKAINKILDEV